MNNQFTKEEKVLIQSYINTTAFKRIGFYLMILFLPFIAEIYRLIEKEDIPAMIMGFLGLFIFVIWLFVAGWGDAKLLTSKCNKILN